MCRKIATAKPCCRRYAGLSRTSPPAIGKAECARGLVVNLKREIISATQIVRAGERYLHKFPDVTEPDVNGRVEILHEDEALIVLNKPAPLPMHAGGRFYRNTLQHILNAAYHPQKPHPGAPAGCEHDGHRARHPLAAFCRKIAAAICEGRR